MATIMPEEKNARRAIKWIGEELQEGQKLDDLLMKAGMMFNLSPIQEQFVAKFFRNAGNLPKSE